MNKIEIDGHSFEFRICSTGSIDPWSLDYAIKNSINFMISDDMTYFVLLDGDSIYKLLNYGHIFEDVIPKTFEEAKEWLDNYTKFKGSLKDSIQSLIEYKEKCDKNKKK